MINAGSRQSAAIFSLQAASLITKTHPGPVTVNDKNEEKRQVTFSL